MPPELRNDSQGFLRAGRKNGSRSILRRSQGTRRGAHGQATAWDLPLPGPPVPDFPPAMASKASGRASRLPRGGPRRAVGRKRTQTSLPDVRTRPLSPTASGHACSPAHRTPDNRLARGRDGRESGRNTSAKGNTGSHTQPHFSSKTVPPPWPNSRAPKPLAPTNTASPDQTQGPGLAPCDPQRQILPLLRPPRRRSPPRKPRWACNCLQSTPCAGPRSHLASRRSPETAPLERLSTGAA